jgi:hypothetical protein
VLDFTCPQPALLQKGRISQVAGGLGASVGSHNATEHDTPKKIPPEHRAVLRGTRVQLGPRLDLISMPEGGKPCGAWAPSALWDRSAGGSVGSQGPCGAVYMSFRKI